MNSLYKRYIQYWPYVTVVIACSLVWSLSTFFLHGETSDSIFAYQRNELLLGQWWRFLTGHFAHNNIYHLLMNMLGLALLAALHGIYYSAREVLLQIFLLSMGISMCVFWLNPQLQYYVGLSGVLHGLFAWGVVVDFYYKRKTAILLLIGLIVKLSLEQLGFNSDSTANLIGIAVAYNVHLYGALLGLVMGVIYVLIKRPSHESLR